MGKKDELVEKAQRQREEAEAAARKVRASIGCWLVVGRSWKVLRSSSRVIAGVCAQFCSYTHARTW